MKTATIKALPAIAAVELPHGYEVIPTAVNGLPVRFVTVDGDGGLQAWSSALPPTFSAGVWAAETESVAFLGDVDALVDGCYHQAADSLLRVSLSALI